RRTAPAVEGTHPARTSSGCARGVADLAGTHHAVAAHGDAPLASRLAPLSVRAPRRRGGRVADFPRIDDPVTAHPAAGAVRPTAAEGTRVERQIQRAIAALFWIQDPVAARRAAMAAGRTHLAGRAAPGRPRRVAGLTRPDLPVPAGALAA